MTYRPNTALTTIARGYTLENTNPPSLLSPIQLVTIMNESIGNTTIDEAIAKNHWLLQKHFFEQLFKPDEYLNLLKDIQSVTSASALQADLEQSWSDEVDEYDDAPKILLREARYACLYIELAKSAENQEHRNQAWAFNNHASLLVGGIIEKLEIIFKDLEADKRTNINSHNGTGRIANFLPAKKEAARLLEKMKPKGGWPTIKSAVEALETPLGDFIKTNKIRGIKSSNICELLGRNWIHKDEIVNSAWLNTKQTKQL
ncbi:hypothetical protein PS850_04783 [Pseudomonas fluorescens]|nr:hypothetical protein PS850_04783 [Pseudomonas fluorescens]